jgi:hypothetical protein
MAAPAHNELTSIRQFKRDSGRPVEPGALRFRTVEDRPATAWEIDAYHADSPSLNRYENSCYRIFVTIDAAGHRCKSMRLNIRPNGKPARPILPGAFYWVRRGAECVCIDDAWTEFGEPIAEGPHVGDVHAIAELTWLGDKLMVLFEDMDGWYSIEAFRPAPTGMDAVVALLPEMNSLARKLGLTRGAISNWRQRGGGRIPRRHVAADLSP